MAEGKNIEIRIAATGGEQAAAEIGKVDKAVKHLDETTSGASSGLGQDLEQRMESLKQKARALSEESEELGKQTERNTSQTRLAGAASIGLAAGGAILAKTFGEIAKGIQSIDVEHLRKLDPAIAEQVETAKKWAEVMASPIDAVQRFFSGSTIGEAFADLNDQLARNAKSSEEAVDRIVQGGVKLKEELKDLAAEIAAANQILDAKRSADAQEQDAADAAAIRAGADPLSVREARAEKDASGKIDSLNQGVDDKARAVQLAERALVDARGRQGVVERDPNSSLKQQNEARTKVAEIEDQLREVRREYDTAKAVAAEAKRGVRAEAGKEFSDIAEQRKQQAAQREAARLKDELEKRQTTAGVETSRAAVAGFGTRDGLGRRDPNAGRRGQALNEIGDSLGQADTALEVQQAKEKILASQGVLGEKMVSALLAMAEKQMQLVRRLEVVESQIKNIRPSGK